jgi:DNA replication and repair protein RecF
VRFQKLILTNFKNYSGQTVNFADGINVFTGLNGMGKTNLLDALYYCCMTKSYFTPQDRYTVNEGEDFFRIEAEFLKGDERHSLEVKVKPGQMKSFILDSNAYDQLSQHVGIMPAVIVAPKDTELILGGSNERRRFIDATLAQLSSAYLQALLDYNQLLQQRNAHLKAVREGRKPDVHLLETYAAKMSGPAKTITEYRSQAVGTLNVSVESLYAKVSESNEKVSISYITGMKDRSMEELCAKNLHRDCTMGRTLEGAHRDDIHIELEGKEMKKYASQGQLKSFLIALNLGKFRLLKETLDIRPVIFLDDSFGKLDDKRTTHLLQILSGPEFGQVFITDTSSVKIKRMLEDVNLGARIFHISEGQVEAVEDFTPGAGN